MLCVRTLEQLQASGYLSDLTALDPSPCYENQTASLLCSRGWLSALIGQLELAAELLSEGIVQLRQLGDAVLPHLAIT